MATPQQNSVVERKHQHLLNVARALYFQSRVPIQFWSNCVTIATHLINRTPSPLLQNKSPYELLYHTKVDYSFLKVFGCLAFASTLSHNCTKFQSRARICVFLGYPHGIKGYRLYDLHTKQFFISRDVVFHEHIFPFQSHSPSVPVHDPFFDTVLPTVLSDSPPFPSTNHITTTSNSLDLALPASPLSNDPSPSSFPPLRKSSRSNRLPSYLRDFHCNLSVSLSPSQLYPLSNYLSYQSLSPSHIAFVISVSSQYEPQFYHQAVPFQHWRQAMQDELAAMEANKTWSVIPLPKGKRSIGCK